MVKTVITSHNEMLRSERLNPDRYTKRGGFASVKHTEAASAQVLSQQLRRKAQRDQTAEQPPQGDVKNVQVKTANKSIRVMKQEAASQKRGDGRLPGGVQDEDSDELTLENILVDIVGQTLANKMPQADPEYKLFKENYDRVVPYFQERFDNLSLDLVCDVFQEASNRQEEIVNVLSRNMLDICDLVQFFARALRQLNAKATVETGEEGAADKKEVSVFGLAVETLAQIGNKILNTDPLQTEVFFLEYGLDELLDVMADNAFKRNEATVLLYCFVQ